MKHITWEKPRNTAHLKTVSELSEDFKNCGHSHTAVEDEIF